MRILSISHSDPLNSESGTPLRIWNVSQRLAQRHEVRFLFPGDATGRPRSSEMPDWLESHPPDGRRSSVWTRVQRQLRALMDGVPPSVQAHRSRALAARVRELTRNEWPEVVIAEDGSAAIELELVPSSLPQILVKHSVHIREIEERLRRTPLHKRWSGWLEELAARRYEQRGLRMADAVVTLCEEDRLELAERYGSFDGVVVANGCPEPERLWSDPGRPIVGILANFRWRPNRWELRWFLEHVLPQLIQHVPSLEVRVIGHPPDSSWRVPENRNVRWLGRVDDLFGALRSCRVLALPVRFGSGIRTRLLDGLALGMPIVTTPLGIRGVNIRPGVEADVAADADVFADRIVHLLRNAEARERRHGAALALARSMTWESSLERLEELLGRLAR